MTDVFGVPTNKAHALIGRVERIYETLFDLLHQLAYDFHAHEHYACHVGFLHLSLQKAMAAHARSFCNKDGSDVLWLEQVIVITEGILVLENALNLVMEDRATWGKYLEEMQSFSYSVLRIRQVLHYEIQPRLCYWICTKLAQLGIPPTTHELLYKIRGLKRVWNDVGPRTVDVYLALLQTYSRLEQTVDNLAEIRYQQQQGLVYDYACEPA
jgi:hypothetical protein